MRAVGALGRHLAVGSLLVVRSGFSPSILRDSANDRIGSGVSVGASTLPNGAGAWLRVLAHELGDAVSIVEAAQRAARRVILHRAIDPEPPETDRSAVRGAG